MRPRVGLTAGSPPAHLPSVLVEAADILVLPGAYWRAVWDAGGVPMILPPLPASGTAEALAGLDGLLLTGGPDPDPAHFGEEPRPGNGRIDPERDGWELALIRAALEVDLPLLAVCRGMQMLNVAAGGTVVQDLGERTGDVVKHRQAAPRWYPTHLVSIHGASLLRRILTGLEGDSEPFTLRVNSFHHQAVAEPAPGFLTTAVAADGVSEAIESDAHSFVLGVQWHPEAMWRRDEGSRNLFRGLVAAAHARRAGGMR